MSWLLTRSSAARWLSPVSFLRASCFSKHRNHNLFPCPEGRFSSLSRHARAACSSAAHPHSRNEIQAGAVQPVDYSTLLACAHELQKDWIPAKVEQVVMSDAHTLSLRLRAHASATTWLNLSWHPACARLSTNPQAPMRGGAAEVYSFAMAAASNLLGLVLVSVEVPQPWERVVALRFGARPGEANSRSLYCEVMSRYSNLLLTTHSDTILACAYQVGGAMSSLRQLQAGKPYAFPPVTHGIPPDSCTTLGEWQTTVAQAAALVADSHQHSSNHASNGRGKGAKPKAGSKGVSWCSSTSNGAPLFIEGVTRAFTGVSPALVRDMCEAAGVPATVHVAELGAESWAALYAQWGAWLARCANSCWSATSDEALTRYSVLGAAPRSHPSVAAMLEAYYGQVQAGAQHAVLHTRLAGAVGAALKKARGRARAFQQQLANADEADAVQKQGDLITANLYRIPPGASSVEVEDWDTGEAVTVTLSPLDPPTQVAAALYKRARKLRRAVAAVAPLLDAALQEVDYLEGLESDVAALAPHRGGAGGGGGSGVAASVFDDMAALREVQEELVSGGYTKAPPDAALAAKAATRAAKAGRRAAAKGGMKDKTGAEGGALGFRRFTSPGGYQVLVGRSNIQNDHLSTKVAADSDLWMHVRGRPGSHTVLRVPAGKPTPSLDDEDVQFAADLAAYFSKAKGDGKADVIVARASAVKKPKGAKPGQVMVTKELGNVVARPEQSAAAKAGEEEVQYLRQ